MATLLERLSGGEDQIPVHYFYASLVGLADGQFTRSQLETHFNIGTTGTDKAQLDFMVNGYNDAADKGRYLNAIHASFMLIESGVQLDTNDIQLWLNAAELPY